MTLNSVSFVLPRCFLNVAYQKFFTLKKQDKLLLDMNESKIFLRRIIRKIVFFALFIYFSFDAKFFENGSKHWKWHSEFSDVWILKTFRVFFFFSYHRKKNLNSLAWPLGLDLIWPLSVSQTSNLHITIPVIESSNHISWFQTVFHSSTMTLF